jgi:transposase
MHGVADHDAHDAKAAAETGQRAEIVTAVVPPLQRQHRLRSQT